MKNLFKKIRRKWHNDILHEISQLHKMSIKPQELLHKESVTKVIIDPRQFVPHGSIKLHIGCGTVYKEGWINIDNNSDNNIEKLDLNWDLRNPLPFSDDSVDFIYNEHFLEHLTVEEGICAIKDFYRVLKIGGVMRIAMPDLEKTMRGYFDENWKENNYLCKRPPGTRPTLRDRLQ